MFEAAARAEAARTGDVPAPPPAPTPAPVTTGKRKRGAPVDEEDGGGGDGECEEREGPLPPGAVLRRGRDRAPACASSSSLPASCGVWSTRPYGSCGAAGSVLALAVMR